MSRFSDEPWKRRCSRCGDEWSLAAMYRHQREWMCASCSLRTKGECEGCYSSTPESGLTKCPVTGALFCEQCSNRRDAEMMGEDQPAPVINTAGGPISFWWI